MVLRFCFGIGDAFKLAQELLRGIHVNQRNVVVMAEQVDDGFGLVQPQQPVIDEHARQLVADRLMDQTAATAESTPPESPQITLPRPTWRADLLDRLLAEGAHGPVAGQPCDLADEIANELGAVGRVHHFRVEHQPVIFSLLVLNDGERRVGGRARHRKARRHFGDAVAMAHPDRMLFADAPGGVEQLARRFHLDIGAAEFAVMAALDLAAELGGHGHLAVADAEHGNAGIEDRLRRARRTFFMHRFRPAGEDHGFRLHLAEGCFRLLERHDFGIDALLADAAGDQLRHLAAEIDNQNLVMRRGHGGRRLAGGLGCCHIKQLRDERQRRKA